MGKELESKRCKLCGEEFKITVWWQEYHPKCGKKARVARYLEKYGFKK